MAQWLEALLHCRHTPNHRRLLAAKTLGAKVKPDPSTKRLPTSAAAATAARALARHVVIRRLLAGYLSRLFTQHAREDYCLAFQYGLVPGGLDAAPRRHQLLYDLCPTNWGHAALDIKNAHSSIALLPCYLVLAARADASSNDIDRLFMLYFLSYYHFARHTYIQVGASYRLYLQTSALDQGEAAAAHIFGLVVAMLIVRLLAPRVPSLRFTLVHDDTTFAGPIFQPSDPAAPPPPPAPCLPVQAMPPLTSALDADCTPLAFAVFLYAELLWTQLRCALAGHKTQLLHHRLPGSHVAAIHRHRHLFPAGTAFTDHAVVLAGTPFGSTPGILLALEDSIARYRSLIARLLDLPALGAQIRILILLVSCRPSSVFGLVLRTLPHALTAATNLPSSRIDGRLAPFTAHLRHELLSALDVAPLIETLTCTKPNRVNLERLTCLDFDTKQVSISASSTKLNRVNLNPEAGVNVSKSSRP